MLIHNQGLQNLNIADELIEGHLKEFAMAYIQRKPVLNLTVGKLEDDLVKEIEGLETDTDKEYNIKCELKTMTVLTNLDEPFYHTYHPVRLLFYNDIVLVLMA